LFEGKWLAGWEANERTRSFAVEDGRLLARGGRSTLFYTDPAAGADFKSFEFAAKAKTNPRRQLGWRIAPSRPGMQNNKLHVTASPLLPAPMVPDLDAWIVLMHDRL